MDPREAVRIAARSVAAHRLRSALTVAGIVIGIAAVVAFATFGTSVQTDIVAEFQDTSASEIYVVTGGGGEDGPPGPGGGFVRPAVTTHDLSQLADIDGVRAVVPRGAVPVASVTYANETVTGTSLTATTPDAFAADQVVDGRPFEPGEPELVVNEAAVGAFRENVSVGDAVTVTVAGEDPQQFTVVGVAEGIRGDVSAVGRPRPAFYVPADPHYRTTVESPTVGVDQRAYPQVTVVAEAGRVPAVQATVEDYVGNASDAAAILSAEEITVRSTADVVEGIQEVLQDVTRLATGIGVLALVVGTVGIANIMLVSVTERTKEIGIMKAIGARNREIMALFVVESVILGALGAVLGIPVGLAAGYAATHYAEVGFTVPFGWVALAVAVGVGIGVLAGLYPAWRAARVDPIEALRYE